MANAAYNYMMEAPVKRNSNADDADYGGHVTNIDPKTGRIALSYSEYMGKVQPAHMGSQSAAPNKESGE